MIGLLVHGSNHFIVEGPLPSPVEARALVWRWEFPRVGDPPAPGPWRIVTKAFREDLEWAVALAGETKPTPAVLELLEELRGRGVVIHHAPGPLLPANAGDIYDRW
jgi:hypothetical protein